jgi:hypothetical protein
MESSAASRFSVPQNRFARVPIGDFLGADVERLAGEIEILPPLLPPCADPHARFRQENRLQFRGLGIFRLIRPNFFR